MKPPPDLNPCGLALPERPFFHDPQKESVFIIRYGDMDEKPILQILDTGTEEKLFLRFEGSDGRGHLTHKFRMLLFVFSVSRIIDKIQEFFLGGEMTSYIIHHIVDIPLKKSFSSLRLFLKTTRIQGINHGKQFMMLFVYQIYTYRIGIIPFVTVCTFHINGSKSILTFIIGREDSLI
jgi:hypothetical protein